MSGNHSAQNKTARFVRLMRFVDFSRGFGGHRCNADGNCDQDQIFHGSISLSPMGSYQTKAQVLRPIGLNLAAARIGSDHRSQAFFVTKLARYAGSVA
jgi:hypothetical protein